MQAAAFVQPRLPLARGLSSRTSTQIQIRLQPSSTPRLGASKAIVAFKEEEVRGLSCSQLHTSCVPGPHCFLL